MADATDTPRGAPAPYPASSRPAAALPPASIPQERDEQREYRPLAVLAVVGLGFAILYALCMIIGAAIALIQGQPWILPGWTAVFPLAGTALALIAWVQVQRSEGTLGGRKLALAGAAICAMVGLVYWSYYLATFLAMRQRADAVSREWMTEVSKGNLVTAYWYTLDPTQRPRLPANPESDPEFRHTLEFRWNSSEGGHITLSQFERRDEVHLLRQIGPDVRIEPLGVSNWEFKGEGYLINQAYRLTGPEGSFDLEVNVVGKDAKHQEFAGRQWFIVPERLKVRPETSTLTDQGVRALALRSHSRAYLDGWMAKVARGQVEESFLETYPVSERERLRVPFRERRAASDCLWLASMLSPPGCDGALLAFRAAALDGPQMDFLPEYKAFLEGNFVHGDRARFWVTLDDKQGADASSKEIQKRQDLVQNEVKAFLAHPGPDFGQSLQVNKGYMPLTHEENGRYYVEQEFSLRLHAMRALVEGTIVLECSQEDAAKGPPVNWRLVGLELARAKTMAPPSSAKRVPGMPDAPGDPGAAGRGGP